MKRQLLTNLTTILLDFVCLYGIYSDFYVLTSDISKLTAVMYPVLIILQVLSILTVIAGYKVVLNHLKNNVLSDEIQSAVDKLKDSLNKDKYYKILYYIKNLIYVSLLILVGHPFIAGALISVTVYYHLTIKELTLYLKERLTNDNNKVD